MTWEGGELVMIVTAQVFNRKFLYYIFTPIKITLITDEIKLAITNFIWY